MAARAASKQTAMEEVDFLGVEKMKKKVPSSLSVSTRDKPRKPRLDRPLSVRGLQTAISKIDPEVLRNLIASGPSTPAASAGFTWKTRSPSGFGLTDLPVYTPIKHFEICEQGTSTTAPASSASPSPMTIFYNGRVAVFDLPREEAENILRLAIEETLENHSGAASMLTGNGAPDDKYMKELQPAGGVPQLRRESLERFLEKRKERLMPYDYNSKGSSK